MGVKVGCGLLSLTAAVAAGFQTQLRLAEKTARHLESWAKFSSVRRDIERLLSTPHSKRKAFDKRVDEIKDRLDYIYESAPLAMNDPAGLFA